MTRLPPPPCLAGLALLALATAARPSAAATLRVITVDVATGKPLAARVSVRGSDGEWRWGLDAAGRPFSHGGLPRLWSAGEIEVELPAGKTEVIASRPFSSPPATREIEVPAQGVEVLTLSLERGVDLRARGWYGGDAHTHVVHGERHHAVDLRVAARIARAEGLDWIAFGETWTTLQAEQPPPAEMSALCRSLSDAEFLCGWTKEHPKDHLGHMAAFPLGGDRTFEETCGGNDYQGSLERRERYTHFEILRSLREAGSLAVYTHPTREYGGSPESPANIARELPFDVVAAPWALEGLDVLTDAPNNAGNLKLWFFLLDRGHRLAACGFSDACYDRRGEFPGDTRTYLELGAGGSPKEMKDLIGAARSGRTFATTGPLVIFRVDGKPPGAVFPADGTARAVEIEAWNLVDHHDPRKPAFLEKLVALRNGKPWRELALKEEHQARWTLEIAERENAWYAVEARGSHPGQFAITSPVYFEDAGRQAPVPARATVRGSVRGGGAPLAGRARAMEYGRDRRKVVEEAPFDGGLYRLSCPAACRNEIEVEGFEKSLKSIFLDYDPLYRDLFWPIRRDRLSDPEFYREIEKRLAEVVLDFELVRKKE